ncbi:hypothetical protein V8G54_033456 [Vigna mungo]|uniref:Uncharacterized protein n=1 Tax=Vigna mungo TaxID=3915 RepID=A0AAQ3RGC9_VIGMU
MNQDVNTKFFLELHNIVNFHLNETDVIFLRDLFSLEFTANSSEVYSLRKRSNCSGWKNRKIQFLLLSIQPGANIRHPAMISALQSCSGLLDGLICHPWRGLP